MNVISGGFKARDFDHHYQSDWEIKKFAGKLKQIVSLLTGYTVYELEKEEIKNRLLPEEWMRYYYSYYKMKSNINLEGRITKYFASRKEAEDYEFSESANQVFDKSKLELVSEGITIRKLLQELGTEALREVIHPNVHINALFVDYQKVSYSNPGQPDFDWTNYESEPKPDYPNWLITDVRFLNEIEAIKNKGGITIRIERFCYDSEEDFLVLHPRKALSSEAVKWVKSNDTDRIKRVAKEWGYKSLSEQHPSETALDNYDGFNYIIQNDRTIQDLIIKVKEILIKEKIIS